MAHGRGGQLGHEGIGVESLEREGGDQVRHFPIRHELGERDSYDRGRLEPVGSPPGRDVEVVDLRLPEDRAVVGRQIAETGPRAEHPRPLELREELDGMSGGVLEERKCADALVRRVRLDLRTDEELAAVRLRDVHVELRRDDDDVEERLHGLRDESLEDVRRDREPNAGEPADQRRPACRGAHDLTAFDPSP